MSGDGNIPGERIKWAARLTTLAAGVILVIVFTFISRPVWFLLPLILPILVAIIAWLLPEVGDVIGAIIVIGSTAALINIVPMNYDFGVKVALVAPWVIFLIGGIFHILTAFKRRKIK